MDSFELIQKLSEYGKPEHTVPRADGIREACIKEHTANAGFHCHRTNSIGLEELPKILTQSNGTPKPGDGGPPEGLRSGHGVLP